MNLSIKNLGDICEFQGGSQPPKSQFVYEPKKDYVRFLQIRDFFSEKNHTYIPINKKNKLCNKDDIMIGRYGASVGKILTGKTGAYNVALMKAIPNEKVINKKYLWYYFHSSYFQINLKKVSTRQAQNGFSKEDIFYFPILLPTLSIQQKIVAKLDKIFAEIDKAIAATEANINNVKMLFENYLNNYFDNNHDLTSMPMVDVCEELFAGGDVPKDRFSKLKTSKFFIPIFSNGEKNKGLYGFTDKPRVTKPSITISARGTIGYSEVRYEPFYPAIRLIVATPKTELIELDYFKYAIKICKFINSGTSIPQLTIPHIKNYIIKFPQSKEKQKILLKKMINFDLNINQIVFLNSNKLIQLSKLKNSILQQAFNGELVKKAA